MTERTKEDRRAEAERRLTEIAESTTPLTVSMLAAPGPPKRTLRSRTLDAADALMGIFGLRRVEGEED